MFSGNIRFVIRLYMLHDYNNVHTNDPIRNISISYRRWNWCWSLDYGGTSSHKSSFDDIINAIIADVWCDIDLTVLKPSTFCCAHMCRVSRWIKRSGRVCRLVRKWWACLVLKIQYIPRKVHTVFALLCFVAVIQWLIFPYPPGLLHWHCGNLTIAPVPAKQPWWIWINTSCEFIMNDCITTTKQSTTKPCAYFLGYTLCVHVV